MTMLASTSAAARLEDLLLKWEEVYEQGQNLPAEELCVDCPEVAPELQRRIDVLLRMENQFGATGAMDSAEHAETPPKLSGSVGLETQYTVLRQHAEGGLGEVYLAHDTALQREVAVKTLKAACLQMPERKGRFLKEAQITGQLEHPGIVPVYGLGRSKDGQPLYAMRFIRGDSLEEQIRDCHAGGASTSEVRRLLRHLVSACRTVHYAHSRRVLHCDIKPLNIMLGKFGETFVLDWGEAVVVNAHTLATEGPVPAAKDVNEQTDSPTGGTIPYMPPERVDGKGSLLDPTSDVYSLGATLYKVLTGRDAFRAATRHELIDKILTGGYAPIREINGGVPPTLAAIAAKAMSVRREDRYESAGQLADDLQAWMDDEPVACRRERWSEWLGRVVRRHRAAAMGLLATLLAVVVATSVLAAMSLKSAQQRKSDLEMVEAARESGLIALARFAASQVERDTETIWKTLEQAAANPDAAGWIREIEQTGEPSQAMLDWLSRLYTEHREGLNGSSWFVLGANGDQLGRVPEGRFTLEDIRNFSHKSYFHGEEIEYPEETPRPPIQAPSLSTVFWSSSDQVRKIAYSVPIWDAGDTGKPVGVLVMTVKLGDVKLLDIDVGGEVERQALLLDVRPDWKERQGTVLQHPGFREERIDPDQAPLVEEQQVAELEELRRSSEARIVPRLNRTFTDPILKQSRLAAIAPVQVRGECIGWFTVVAEPGLPDSLE